MRSVLVTAIIGLLLVSVIASATGFDSKIGFEGRLTDTSGKPVEGAVTLKIEVFDAAAGGNLVWQETKSVTARRGIFQTTLSPPISVTFDETYWAEVTYAGKVMSPRLQLAAAPYAMRAGIADAVANLDASKLTGKAPLSAIPALTSAWTGTLDASRLSGSIAASMISGKVTSAATADNSLKLNSKAENALSVASAATATSASNAAKLNNKDEGALNVGLVGGAAVSAGTISVTNSKAITFASDTTVGRKSAFTSTPIVTCSAKNDKTFCSVGSLSTTGFTAKVYTDAGAGTTTDVYWIAVGP